MPSEAPKPTAKKGDGSVVASGESLNLLQLPSPVFCVEWVDATHAIVGGGGGGSRFGMVNVLALLEINSCSSSTATPGSPAWRLAHHLDLEDAIPWCLTAFLPYDATTAATEDRWPAECLEAAKGVIGFVVVSGVKSFTLVAVCRSSDGGSLTLKSCAVVSLPFDDVNPDKKPVALVRNMIVIAQDCGEVWLYSISSLLLSSQSSATAATVAVSPLAKWMIGTRLNDLHANRMLMVAAPAGSPPSLNNDDEEGQACAHLLEYVVMAAAAQDKTLRVAAFRLRHHSRRSTRATDLPEVVELCQLTGKELGIHFNIMRSSLRLVRVFGLQNLSREAEAAARDYRVQESLQAITTSPSAAVVDRQIAAVGLLLVAYDPNSNSTFFVKGSLDAALVPHSGGSQDEASSVSSPRTRRMKESKYGVLSLTYRADAGGPAEVVKEDAISFIASFRSKEEKEVVPPAPSASVPPSASSSAVKKTRKREVALPADWRERFFGVRVPSEWIATTVEGRIVKVAEREMAFSPTQPPPDALSARTARGQLRFTAVDQRPPQSRVLASCFPSLHQNPITCVAVSSQNDVITTDIAQRVVLTFMDPPVLLLKGKGTNAIGKRTDGAVVPLFPSVDGVFGMVLYIRCFLRVYRVVLFISSVLLVLLLSRLLS